MSSIALTLTPVSCRWLAAEDRWEVSLRVFFESTGQETFELDKATACLGGRLTNCVFEVQGPTGEVGYQGMMKKRAHPGPEGFHHLPPGQSVQALVDIGAGYAFPPEGGSFSVRFDHFNHFSKDGIQLVSEPVSLELKR